MSNDLVVQLGARLDQFAADLNQAGDMADSAVSRIESSFSNLNPSFGGLAGLGGIAAAATASIAGLLAILQGVNSELAKISQTAQFLNTTTDEIQKLQFAGASNGITSDQSLADLQNVGKLLNDANVNENSLTKLLDANNIKYKDQAGQLININQLLSIGADLVQNASKNGGTFANQTVIAQMLGLSQQWVPVLAQGAQAFNQIADDAQAAGAIIDSETIDKATEFDKNWRKSSVEFSTYMKATFSDLLPFIDDLIEKTADWVKTLPSRTDIKLANNAALKEIGDKTGLPDSGTIKVDAEGLNQAFAAWQNSPIFSLSTWSNFGKAFADSLRFLNPENSSKEIPGFAASQVTEPSYPSQSQMDAAFKKQWAAADAAQDAAQDKSDTSTVIPTKKTDDSNDAFDRAENQIIKRTADYDAQTASIGENTQAKVQAKAIADLQTAADRAGLTLTEEQKQKILDLAAAEGVAAQAAADRNQKLQQQNELLAAIGDQGISVLDGLRTGSLSAAQAVTQLTNYLITAIEKAELLGTGPLAGFLGTAAEAGSGTTGGLLGALTNSLGFGISSKSQKAADAAQDAEQDIEEGFASGTDSAPGGPAWVGENGPEIMNVPKGAQIIPNDVLRKGGGGDITVNLVEDSSRAGQTQTINSNGGFDLTVFVDAITAKNAANPGSATSAALNSRGRLTSR